MSGRAREGVTRDLPRLRALLALPGIHRVARGAEVAFEAVGRELALRPDFDVTLVGTGAARQGQPYRYRQVACTPRERFERAPSVPPFRNEFVYEEFTYLPGLARATWGGSWDVTCTCSYPFTNWALRSIRSSGRRPAHVYVTQNGDWPAQARNREFRFFDCDGLICTNPDFFERNQDRWRCVLIPNGVDEDRFSPGPGTRARLGLPADAPVVLIVSALMPSKRVLAGLRSVARIPGVHVLVAGDGEQRDEVDRLGMETMGSRYRRVVVVHDSMPDVYRSADVLLHMSQEEPFGIVYLEGLATGLPVVAHASSVTRWIFEDHSFLVDTGDEEAVGDAIVRALAANSSECVAARRSLIERRFTWREVARRYGEFFVEVSRGPV